MAKRWIRSADIRHPGPPEPQPSVVLPTGQTPDRAPSNARQSIWSYVSSSPLRSLWNLEGVPARVIAKNTWKSLFADDLLGRSAELGFYFLFALFPTLFMATAILGLAARSAPQIYESLLVYLAIVVRHPPWELFCRLSIRPRQLRLPGSSPLVWSLRCGPLLSDSRRFRTASTSFIESKGTGHIGRLG